MLENARFHHIGFAVNDIEKVKPEYVAGGYVVSETVIDPESLCSLRLQRRISYC